MENLSIHPLREMEIPAIIQGMGTDQQTPDLLVYDSLRYTSGFIQYKPFRSRHFSVILVARGVLELNVNLFEYKLKAGNVIIIPPLAIREMNWKEGETHFISLIFTPDFLRGSGILGKYFDIANFVKEGLVPYRQIDEQDHYLLVDLIRVINNLLERDKLYGTDLEILKNLCGTILLKIQQYYDDMETDKDVSSTIIYRFLKLLSLHYLTEREVRYYAGQLHMHEKYLSQLLKKKTGKTARQFIIDMVILEAKVLLDNRSLAVKQVADLLNFENQFHFSRFFRQYAGVSPTLYRKGIRDQK